MTTLEEYKKLHSAWASRKARAKQLYENRAEKVWCFALIGLTCSFEQYKFLEHCNIRKVVEPPDFMDLASAAENYTDYASVSRYSSMIQYELALSQSGFKDEECLFTYAWWIICALRVRAGLDFLVPVAANNSWSVISGLPDNSCKFSFIEDIPRAIRVQPKQSKITKKDLNWVEENLMTITKLLEKPNFRLATMSLTTYNHHADKRMCAAALWSGIESLFNINAELTYRLSAYVAAFLYKRGDKRLAAYKKNKKLYATRSQIVHGASMQDEDLLNHIQETRTVLCECLRTIIKNKKIPTNEDLDKLIHT